MTELPAAVGPSSSPGRLGEVLLASIQAGPELPRDLDATVVIRARRGESWTLRVAAGRPALAWGEEPDPDATITASDRTWRAVAGGTLSGIDAFLDGELTVRGNLALALRLAALWDTRRGGPGAARGRDVVAGDLSTFLLEAGEGPTVVLLHGLGATNASMLPTFRDLAVDHHVVAPDLPGFGESDKPLRSLHAAFYAGWLLDLLDVLGIERATFIGNSMGGRVAVEMGLRHPERVDRLVLLAPSPAFLKNRDHVRLVRVLRPELALVPIPLPHRYVEREIRRMFARPSRLDDAWYAAATDEFLRVFGTVRGRVAFFSAARQIYLEEPHEGRGRFWDRLPSLSVPALFVWGARDRLVPASFARHVEAALPTATSVVLDDCGHVPQYELPDTTSELIRGFLADDEAAD